jgi:hypothetical protein
MTVPHGGRNLSRQVLGAHDLRGFALVVKIPWRRIQSRLEVLMKKPEPKNASSMIYFALRITPEAFAFWLAVAVVAVFVIGLAVHRSFTLMCG